MHTILVLPDGETWTMVNGCTVMVIDDQQFMDLCDGNTDVNDLIPVDTIIFHGGM